MKINYSDEDFIQAICSNYRWSDVFQTLGIKPHGGNYKQARKKALQLNVDISHFTLKGQTRKKSARNIPLKDILVNPSTYTNTTRLKQKLWQAGLLEKKCSKCKLTEWNGVPAPLELDHKNGNCFDNRLENLRILCPNCHAQTDTNSGKNLTSGPPELRKIARREYEKQWRRKKAEQEGRIYRERLAENCSQKTCSECTKIISTKAIRCKSCAGKVRGTKIEWPSYKEVLALVEETNFTQAAKKLGVSDNAIRKFISRNK